jgi:hypothetical protein
MNDSSWVAPTSHGDVAVHRHSEELNMEMNSEMCPATLNPVDISEDPESAVSLSSPASTQAALPLLRAHHGLSQSLPSTLRRRASQGSRSPAPSPVSRFLMKATTPLQLPSFERLGISTSVPPTSAPRTESTDRSFHKYHSFAPASSRPYSACEIRNGPSPPGEYGLGLPLTPPADDDDKHITWNPKSTLPMVETGRDSDEYTRQASLDDHQYHRRNSSIGQPSGNDSSSGTAQAEIPSNSDPMMHNLQIRQFYPERGWLVDGIETTSKLRIFLYRSYLGFSLIPFIVSMRGRRIASRDSFVPFSCACRPDRGSPY